jgi:hypothetical protein
MKKTFNFVLNQFNDLLLKQFQTKESILFSLNISFLKCFVKLLTEKAASIVD